MILLPSISLSVQMIILLYLNLLMSNVGPTPQPRTFKRFLKVVFCRSCASEQSCTLSVTPLIVRIAWYLRFLQLSIPPAADAGIYNITTIDRLYLYLFQVLSASIILDVLYSVLLYIYYNSFSIVVEPTNQLISLAADCLYLRCPSNSLS